MLLTDAWRQLGTALMLLAAAVAANAATVSHMQVERQGDAYRVTARMQLAVNRKQAFAAATDFARLPEYSSMIEATRLLGHHRLSSRMHLCVLFFCKTVQQVMRYRMQPPQQLVMQVVLGQGDLSAGTARWRFIRAGKDTTILLFNAKITPDFWVPPLIGPWAIAHALRKQAASTAEAIEQLADERAAAAGKGRP